MKKIGYIICAISLIFSLSSCEDMLDVDSSRYVTVDDNDLSSANDSIYSILGLLRGLQDISERYVLLGEMRADLLDPTRYTSAGIRELSNFTVQDTSTYANPKDYYAIINNCNYFIGKTSADDSPLKKENVVARVIRAWVYMQISFNWGKAYYFTEPLLTIEDTEKSFPAYDISRMIDVLIEELEPLADAEYPNYGDVYDFPSSALLFPVELLLADLYLWRGSSVDDYVTAANYYANFIYDRTFRSGTYYPSVTWSYSNFINQDFENMRFSSNSWSDWVIALGENVFGELVAAIQMATSDDRGKMSQFPSTWPYYETSGVINNLWDDQIYVLYYNPTGAVGTNYYTMGDLRKAGNYSNMLISISGNVLGDEEDQGTVYLRPLYKFYYGEHIPIYRMGLIYLRFAEALNRAGKPNAAFAILKYGLGPQTFLDQVIPEEELLDAPYITIFNNNIFSSLSLSGIHARGSGDAAYNPYYVIGGLTGDLLTSKSDTIDWVEKTICDELAMETSFEGNRFQDLMRFSIRRNDPAFLASKIAEKHTLNGGDGAGIYQLLLNKENWFLPEPKK